MKGIGACDPARDNTRASHQDHAAWTKDDGCSKERHRIMITLKARVRLCGGTIAGHRNRGILDEDP